MPETETLAGVTVAVRPIDGVSVKLTIPLKLFNDDIVSVELPDVPDRIVSGDGLAAIVKSTTWTPTVAVCVRDPLELVTVAV